MIEREYPRLTIDPAGLERNARALVERCASRGIRVAGVVKGCNGIPELARAVKAGGAAQIATSRLEQIEACIEAGVPGPYMLIRVPMPSEVRDAARLADYTLHSEMGTLRAFAQECVRQGVQRGVVIMVDLGDLREGFWNMDEAYAACMEAEAMEGVTLSGVGVNLSCYGAIKPTQTNLGALAALARRVEAGIGRPLEIVSGGATFSYALVHDGDMPEGINHLRLGENMLLGYDLPTYWGYTDMDYIRRDCFVLEAEVIEVKTKPSYPVGEIFMDAFGNRPTYTDRGERRRALLGVGKADVGDITRLHPTEPGIEVLGGASDYVILDIEDATRPIRPGDTVAFTMEYTAVLFSTMSPGIKRVIKSEGAK